LSASQRARASPPPAAIGACAITSAETSTVTSPPDGATAVRLRGIGKRFPGVVANHDIDIDVRAGTVHAIVGENGAGKSTLMKILYGVQKPDSGTIEVDGRVAEMGSPADAIKLGIGMVFQHFMLADNLTVLENVVLGAEKLFGIGEKARAELERISTTYGFGLDPDELVETLGVGERQRVEILKVLYRGAKVIILDEPTAVLVPQEVDALFDNLRELKKEGHTLLFISHKLDEVLAVADDITVVRRGTTVAAVRPTEVTARKLAELMVGSELPSPDTSESTVTDQEMLELVGVTLVDVAGRRLLSDISLTIHRGEVLGIAGVEGNGQTELTEVVMGMRHPSAGRVELADADVTAWSTKRRREAGIGYVPEDRQRHGLLLDAPLWENRILGHQTRPPSVKGGWLDRAGARKDSTRIVEGYDVRTPSIDTTARALSGGNQQKFIVGREMSGDPVLLVASHPTRGVDVGAQAAIWEHIREARRQGLAVLLISADLDELIGLSDSIKVILRGRFVGDFDPQHVTPQELGSAMTGAAADPEPPDEPAAKEDE
jgi:general nucleoside transport system ATP-binding protein